MEPACANCQEVIAKRAKGYNRHRLGTLGSPGTCSRVFPQVDRDSFICFKCTADFKAKTTAQKKGMKRKATPQSPPKTAKAPSPKLARKEAGGPMGRGLRLLEKKKFIQGFRILLHIKKVKEAMIKAMSEIMADEVSLLPV